MQKLSLPQLRLSGTSFLLHADYVPAVRFAATLCDDVALLLLETGEHGEYLPKIEDIREIRRILDGEGATLHVHLPTDSNCDTQENTRRLVGHVRYAVERAAPLTPHSFVLHLDFPSLHGTGLNPTKQQQEWTAEALHDIATLLPDPKQLAVENLENVAPAFWDRWLDNTPFSRCLDIGHIWKDGGDPTFSLQSWRERLRVIHLHGLTPQPEASARARDHTTLRFMPEARVDDVMHPLWKDGFSGVLNLEVFSPDDFRESHAVLLRSWERFRSRESL